MRGEVGRGNFINCLAFALRDNRVRREFARSECVINSLARERLNHASRIAHEKKRTFAG